MSIPEIEPVKNHYGNNSATSFDFDFYIERSSQLKVQHTDLNGILTTLKENVDYSIHEIGNENGSYITFPIQGSTHSVLAWDTSTDKKELLTISLNLPLKQEFEFDISGDLDKHQLEKALDYQMRVDQILNRKITRAVLVPEGSELTPSEMIETIHNSRITAVQAANDAKNSANEAKEQLNNVNKRSEEVIQAYTDAKTDITNLKDSSVEEIKAEGAEQINNIKKTGFYIHNDKLYYIDSNGETQEFGGGGGLEVCDIGMALFVDETKGLRRRLNGQIVNINANTQGFLTRLKQITTLYPSLACTEEEWQTVKTMSKLGQCGKFVYNYGSDGTTVISVRLPVVVNINGLADMANAGLIKDESLPNIKATLGMASDSTPYSGAFYVYQESSSVNTSNTSTKQATPWGMKFDASRSSSTYQDNAPVQQEAIQYPYFIQIATGQETEVDIVNTIELNKPSFFGDSKYVPTPVNNLSWLKSEGQQNAEAVYPDVYNWILENVNNGVKGFKRSTETYTDYDYVINTADETFRLPLLNGSENLPSDTILKSVGNTTVNTTETLTLFTASHNGFVSIRAWGYGNAADRTLSAFKNGMLIGSAGINTGSYNQGTVSFEVKRGDVITIRADKTPLLYNYNYFKAVGNGSLYYYVGETVQNENLINAGRLGEELATKTDMQQAAHASMPSDRYDDLILLVSGKSYIAPADGYFVLKKKTTSTTQFLFMSSPKLPCLSTAPITGQILNCSVKVAKGENVMVTYDAGGETSLFRFYYAEGVANN